jgi:hypothetical protein
MSYPLELQVYGDPDVFPDVTIRVAQAYNLSAEALDWHVEAVHGWELHNEGYDKAVEDAAQCILSGGCN